MASEWFPAVAPSTVASPDSPYYAIFLADGTGGTTANKFYAKDSSGTLFALFDSYTNEQAQDAVGTILTDTSTVDFTYDDAGNTISAIVITSPSGQIPVGVTRTISTTAPLTGGGDLSANRTLALTTSPVSQTPVGVTRTISTTAPITGGGDLSADRTLALTTSPASGSVAVATGRLINTTAPITGGGDLSADRTIALTTTPAGQTPVGSTRLINTTAPITGGGDLSADRTIAISAATTAAAGSMSALDKLKLDNAWIDVSANTTAQVLTTNTGAQNITAINAILAAAPNGSVIFFPKGIFLFNAAWTMPSKSLVFQGVGSNRAGSPATAYTELQWNANVGGTIITLAGSNNAWYTEFNNLTFTASVDQSAGFLLDANGNVGMNVRDCSMQGAGGNFFGVLNYGGGAGSNSGNSTVVDNVNMSNFKDQGIRVNAAGSSLVISNCVIQGQWGTTVQCATACISGGWVGALQIDSSDLIGAVNNLLLNPVLANSEVCASVFVTNTYLDNSFGSCLKITGTGATVRCRFDECSFTTSSATTALSAVEIGNSFAYAVGGMGIDFINCNILNTFATTGTTNGFLLSNTADYSISNCRIAGWTNGINHTPNATAGRSQPVIVDNHIGTTGGFGVNTVGILLNAGTNGSLMILSNTMTGNTTAITDNTTVTTTANNNRIIQKNLGFNPKSVVATPAVPATTVAVFNSTGVDVTVFLKDATPANLTVITIGGVAVTTNAPVAAVAFTAPLAANQSIAMTFTTAPTWVWVGS